MNLTSIPASIILLVMTAYLCIYIYRKDTIEKEPISLLAILFAAGMICYAMAAVLEHVLVGGVDQLFLPYMSFDGNGLQFYRSESVRIAHFLACALVLALIEEMIRAIVLCLLTHKNKNFNYSFDGMVYAVILYLGFGLVEAFRYVKSGGFGSVLLRAIACIPAHLFLGVIMGCFYTTWHKRSIAKKEKGEKGIALPYELIVPILIHAIYSFFNRYASLKGGYLYEIVTVILCVIGVIIIRQKAAKDTVIATLLSAVILSTVIAPMSLKAVVVKTAADYRKYDGFYYNQLDLNGLCVYNFLKEDVPKGNMSGTFEIAAPVLNWDTIWCGVHAFHLENPKYYWVDGGAINASYRGLDSYTMTLTISNYSYWNQTLDKKAAKQKLNKAVKKIVKEAKKKKSKIEQIEYVHDYISNNCIYDHDRLASCKQSIHDPFDELIYSAYGCLVQKRAVCAGYAKAFQLIMQELGIKCDYVKGVAGKPGDMGAHGWNCVQLAGDKYWVDVTWDDLDTDGKNKDASHTYCMKTTSSMSKDHKAKDNYTNMKQPTAKGTKFNYFKWHKYVLDDYTPDKLDNLLAKQKKPLKEVHFATAAAYKKAVKSIQNGGFSASKSLDGSRYWYWQKPDFWNLIFTKQ
ncbi:MAG: PrsW family glutamic-type intramembrane protease [Eubacteriales bacterium]|nr:PrsW family glutamic-type intramembrane protease [Eubacteriales bacterium]